MLSLMIIRAIKETDWPAILRIQNEVYPDIVPESEAVLRSKTKLGPTTCLTICDRQNNVAGYCLAHPWTQDPASLHSIYEMPSAPQLLYIHDMAIAPSYAGKRLGNRTLQYLQSWAKKHGYTTLSLVSLGQAVSYWQQHGFLHTGFQVDTDQYGEGASYMLKQI